MRTTPEKSPEGYKSGVKISQSRRALRGTQLCTKRRGDGLVKLVDRARGGDVDSFTELVQRYQRLAHGSAIAVVHDADAAQDVVQEAFVAERVARCRADADALEAQPDLGASARATVGRARRLRRFFAQPFFIPEPYTHRPGMFVSRADTLAACTAILDGVHDDVPEDAFWFVGGIDEVLARARGMR